MNTRPPTLILVVLAASFVSDSEAFAGDYGISFHYSSYTPRCTEVRYASPYYSTSYASPYYSTSCASYSDFDGYLDPVVYSRVVTPAVVVRRDCYPASYHTTYTRSKCYTPPVKRVHASLHYNSGRRTRHYRTCDTGVRRSYSYRSTPSYRHYSYRTPTYRYSARRVDCRPALRVSVNRHGSSYHRNSYRPYRSYRGHGRPSYHRGSSGPRVRIHRR